MKYFFFLILFTCSIYADTVQLIKKQNNDANTTLLVIGGIHGNEPGGYFAPAILASHYTILSKNLWIVPNLNKPSIQANKRGIYGDMNRKFAHIAPNDKDKPTVDAIKEIILSPQVSLVLNLHDGHGFYRKDYEGSIFNPNAWGQTCVIDQRQLNKIQQFGNLDDIAQKVMQNINKQLIKKHHSFNVKNTNTKFDDEAMRNSLTYFAVTHNKPAFAIETSKNLNNLSQKVFYQLIAIEEFMKIMGIEFKRDFTISIKSIEKILKNYGNLNINGNIILNLTDIKKTLRFIPIKSKNNNFIFSHLLGSTLKKRNKQVEVFIGNKQITTLQPEFFEMATDCPQNFSVTVDGVKKTLPLTSTFLVKDDFSIAPIDGVRVNVIGYSTSDNIEVGKSIKKSDVAKRYSIDTKETMFRIEFYKKDRFCAMSIVQFQ